MRPTYGNVLQYDRLLSVFFYTSNVDKLLQARLVFSRFGLTLRHFRGKKEPYDEDYSLGTEVLLYRAIQQVNAEFGIKSIFFVEDTSLRIEALSGEIDYPGLAVKEWFEKITFLDLDEQLNRSGGDRRVIVKSDIGLFIPSLSRPIYFQGSTHGAVATTPPSFEPSTQYPWLTPHTFNGWFVPEGSNKRLGEMEFEESFDFDFRIKSMRKLIARLQELNAVLNLPSNFYTVRKPPVAETGPSLFYESGPHVILVIGPKCAGKTTFADHLVTRDGVIALEASTVLRELASQHGKSVENAREALSFLEEHGWDLVAKKIESYLDRSGTNINLVTGLRTVEELLFLLDKFPGSEVVYVQCDAKIRFERHLRRSRDSAVRTFREFLDQDECQARFGLNRVGPAVATSIIVNEQELSGYKQQIDALLHKIVSSGRLSVQEDPTRTELYRCLFALASLGKEATCEEIAKETERLGVAVRIYNTNRALKALPEFAKRSQRPRHLLSYAVTERGKHLLQLLQKINERTRANP